MENNSFTLKKETRSEKVLDKLVENEYNESIKSEDGNQPSHSP